jgi:murein DD-endopeptidase MepM/ murein hydrolase activator NlpD
MADSLLLKPVDRGRLSSAYGPRYHPILKRRMMHLGVDWAAPRGTPVRAAGHGMVSGFGPFGAYGRYLRIEHGAEVATAYAHLERFAPGLRPGQLVRQGDLIGHVGSSGRATGPHLHYELLVGGRQVDPLARAPTVAQARAPGRGGVIPAVLQTAPDPTRPPSIPIEAVLSLAP